MITIYTRIYYKDNDKNKLYKLLNSNLIYIFHTYYTARSEIHVAKLSGIA